MPPTNCCPTGPPCAPSTQLARVIDCTVAPQPNHVLHPQRGPISSFTCVEYAAQAAALHGILMGAEYDPLKPAFIGAVKDVRLLTPATPAAKPFALKPSKNIVNATALSTVLAPGQKTKP